MNEAVSLILTHGQIAILCSVQKHRIIQNILSTMFWGFPSGSVEKNPPAMQETQERRVPSLSWEDPMKKEITTLSSILAWKIPWKEEP